MDASAAQHRTKTKHFQAAAIIGHFKMFFLLTLYFHIFSFFSTSS